MNTIICKQLEKYKDKSGKIIGYRLVDTQGNQTQMKAEDLKNQIRTGAIQVVNLTLTKDGRLVDGAEPKESKVDPKKQRELEMQERHKKLLQEQLEKQEVLNSLDEDTEKNEENSSEAHLYVVGEVWGKNNKTLGFMVVDTKSENREEAYYESYQDVKDFLFVGKMKLYKNVYLEDHRLVVRYKDEEKAMAFQKLLSDMVIGQIPRKSEKRDIGYIMLEDDWESISCASEDELQEMYGEHIKLYRLYAESKLINAEVEKYDEFEADRLSDVDGIDLCDRIMNSQRIVTSAVLGLCRQFNTKNIREINRKVDGSEEVDPCRAKNMIDLGEHYFDYKNNNMSKSHVICYRNYIERRYDIYDFGGKSYQYIWPQQTSIGGVCIYNTDVATNSEWAEFVNDETLNKIPYKIYKSIMDGTCSKEDMLKLVENIKVSCRNGLYGDTISSLIGIKEDETIFNKILKIGDASEYKKDLLTFCRFLCKADDIIFFNMMKFVSVDRNDYFCRYINPDVPNSIRYFIEKHWKELQTENWAETLSQLKLPIIYDGYFKVVVNRDQDMARTLVACSADSIIDIMINEYGGWGTPYDRGEADKEEVVEGIMSLFEMTYIKLC